MNVARANGIDLVWESFGNPADEAMLLISGLGTQMIRWRKSFCENLAARGYRVIRFDNRDAGLSTHLSGSAAPDLRALVSALMAGDRPDVPYTLSDLTDDAIGLLKALGIARAHVVGRSMGGMIAQILASEHAGQVLSLTSIMSSTGNPALPQAIPEVMGMMMASAPDPAVDLDGFLAARVAFARRIAGTGYSFDEEAHRLLLLEEVRRCYDPGGSARQIAAMAVAGDRRARLATIAVPTLVIHGSDDPLFPPACGYDTAISIPRAIYKPIQGMGHDLPAGLDRTLVEMICSMAGQAPYCRAASGKADPASAH